MLPRRLQILTAALLALAAALPADDPGHGNEAPPPEAPPAENPPPENPDSPPGPAPRVRYSFEEATSEPGQMVNVPFFIGSDVPLAMAAFSVEYDPGTLDFLAPRVSDFVADLLVQIPDVDWRFDWFTNPEEGWVQVSLVIDYLGREGFALPPGLMTSALSLQFRVKDEAKRGRTHLRFTRPEAARYRGNFADGEQPVYNSARRHGKPFTRDDQFHDGVVPDLEDGSILISIIGDVGIFLRGDVNLDSDIDVSDPIALLDFLFLGDETPGCQDAADGNDDGKLDIADPIAILEHLFVKAASGTHFSGIPAEDETPDELGCAAQAP